MVFASLSYSEKEAFFSLLDEYFSSRPEIFASTGADDAGPKIPAGAAASAVHSALASNPDATAKLVSAGLKHGVPKSSPYSAAASNPELNNAVGRVAAASLAFSAPNHHSSSSGTSSTAGYNSRGQPPPLAPPRRSSTVADKGDDAKLGLITDRKIGSLSVSSTRNMFGSLRKTTPQAPPIPPAFPAKKALVPPPVRRVSSGGPPALPRRQPIEQEPEEEEVEEIEEEEEEGPEGEWAEALYDYSGDDPGDLEIQAKQRILVVERTSDDWWTAELDGKRGLVPASYVKLL